MLMQLYILSSRTGVEARRAAARRRLEAVRRETAGRSAWETSRRRESARELWGTCIIVVRHAVATVSAFRPLTATTSKARRRAGEAGQAWRSTTTETRSRALENVSKVTSVCGVRAGYVLQRGRERGRRGQQASQHQDRRSELRRYRRVHSSLVSRWDLREEVIRRRATQCTRRERW